MYTKLLTKADYCIIKIDTYVYEILFINFEKSSPPFLVYTTKRANKNDVG